MKTEKHWREIPIYPHPGVEGLKTPCRRPVVESDGKSQVLARNEPGRLPQRPVEDVDETPYDFFDTRERVKQTGVWPNGVHGLVIVDFDNERCWGTGILIGPNIVLTAAHNLYDYKKKIYGDLETMQFLPGISGQELPFDYVKVEQRFISPNFVTDGEEDYAILILKDPIGYKTGYFGLCPESKDPEHKDIHIYGYPLDKVQGIEKRNTYEMWGANGSVGKVDTVQGIISHIISTNTGQSGSGIWYQKERDYYVYGIHISRPKKKSSLGKRGALVTRACYKRIYEWIGSTRFCGTLFELGKKPDLRDDDYNFDGEFDYE